MAPQNLKAINQDYTHPPPYQNLQLVELNPNANDLNKENNNQDSKPALTHTSTSTTKVIVQQLNTVPFGPYPQPLVCPSCKSNIVSKVSNKSSIRTHAMAVFLCATMCFCCLPYCLSSCKNQHHSCPECHCYLGSYKN